MIISFVRANATGGVRFTDDAKRFNVAITRAKAGVIIAGHLVTSLAASTSGFGPLLYELRKQGAIYDYQHEDTNPPMITMTEEVFKMCEAQFPADTTKEQRRRKREGKDRASHADNTYDTERASESDIRCQVRGGKDEKVPPRTHEIHLVHAGHVTCMLIPVAPKAYFFRSGGDLLLLESKL